MCVCVHAFECLEVGLEEKRKVGEGEKTKKKVSHKIHAGPIVYFWVPGGTVHPSVPMNDREFSMATRKVLKYTAC